jgi:hypothetical protein
MIPQIPTEMKASFQELKFNNFLRQANIRKSKGFAALSMFITVFLLVFQKETWFQQKFMSIKANDLPGKDALYRFLNTATFNWGKFLLLLSHHAISLCSKLTDDERVSVFIIDDSLFERPRSKKVELLSRVFDHVTHKHVKGFLILTLGWSDGATFLPVAFSLMAYANHMIEEASEKIDKRTCGAKRRLEAKMTKPKATAMLIQKALDFGIRAHYAIMDTWFTEEPLIKDLLAQGLHIIGMMKRNKNRKYDFKGKKLSLHQLLSRCNQNKNSNAILGSVITQMSGGTQIKIVFVQHRCNRTKWLAVLSTDTTLSDDEIIRIYGYRWQIEVFFKCNKSLLKMNKEFQCRTYDAQIAHTTIVFSRYILLAWEQRKQADPKTLGYMFFEFGEDIQQIDFKEALLGLLSLIMDITKTGENEKEIIINLDELKNKLLSWFHKLPKYLQNLLVFSDLKSFLAQ